MKTINATDADLAAGVRARMAVLLRHASRLDTQTDETLAIAAAGDGVITMAIRNDDDGPAEGAIVLAMGDPDFNAAVVRLVTTIPSTRVGVFVDLGRVRDAQDREWGTEHDDALAPGTWLRTLHRHLGRAMTIEDSLEQTSGSEHGTLRAAYRDQVLRVAGIALAHVEALDRRVAAEHAAAAAMAPVARVAAPVAFVSRPAPCLDPDKMHGAGDGFGGDGLGDCQSPSAAKILARLRACGVCRNVGSCADCDPGKTAP